MSVQFKLRLAAVALILGAAFTGWWQTRPAPPSLAAKRPADAAASALVDESSYETALRLSRIATTTDEQPYAAAALRVADHALALAFTTALRDAEANPPALSPEALQIQDRLHKSQALMDSDQQRVAQLTQALASATNAQKDALQDALELAKSQLDLDKDEVEAANQDLVAAGGNPQQRIEALLQEHEAEVKTRAAAPAQASTDGSVQPSGALPKLRAWMKVRQKHALLLLAMQRANERANDLMSQRTALAETLESTKGGIAELAHHTKSAGAPAAPTPPAAAAPGAGPPGAGTQRSHEDVTALLNQTKAITANQKVLTLLDRRAADQRQLADVYRRWAGVIELQSTSLVHQVLRDAFVVALVLLSLLLLDGWVEKILERPKFDRRQVETLRALARTGLRVLGVIAILLTLIGAPTQFGTMIGIVGAGLTVALKDFIVAFFGWLVLMGRNGIRLGDWVEINGVSGEVTELGMFHTVLLETGNWSDAGHPTGRRVTFTNSFAIEGHYFNFSTSGQWLWDEVRVVVPSGKDPYPIVESITQLVREATAESARLAEQEWQRAVPAQRSKTFSGEPGVNIKPVSGGVEISVRYITRAQERFALRARLYQAAVDLLGAKGAPASAR